MFLFAIVVALYAWCESTLRRSAQSGFSVRNHESDRFTKLASERRQTAAMFMQLPASQLCVLGSPGLPTAQLHAWQTAA